MKRALITLGLVAVALGVLWAGLASAQEAADAAPAAVAAAPQTEEVSESVMAFIDKGKPIGHVIIVLLIVALFFVADQVRINLLERVRAGEIYKGSLAATDRTSFEQLIERHVTSRVGRLLNDARVLYVQSGNLSLIGAEAEFYREKEEHRFNTFESRMFFLSDTAGGLGLLGTVWGIYRGFAAKSVAQNNEDLLAAMGIALVTTFMGIVVSVIINWMSTEVGAVTRNRIMVALEKVENYRDALVRDRNAA
jgi:biopolymer transport protein ExbB/TolQ